MIWHTHAPAVLTGVQLARGWTGKKWVYGCPILKPVRRRLSRRRRMAWFMVDPFSGRSTEVERKSIGWSLTLHDSLGARLFEGDIIKVVHPGNPGMELVAVLVRCDNDPDREVVAHVRPAEGSAWDLWISVSCWRDCRLERIGNATEHPDILRGWEWRQF